ncbi:threonylcarbamoyl-AMP synthase [Candidatus Saccharibacteria bacterium]|nr:threonylcarbamoyl-AMP synthase [Candidatus Saccharibacteria bacterium]
MAYVTDSFDDEVVRLLKNGGAGLLPTDTIYGLSARALDADAVEKLRRLKGRDSNKPFIVLMSDVKMLDLLSIPQSQAEIVKEYWPGPLSMIFNAPKAPDWLRATDGTLAIRLPVYDELRQLIQLTGPLISTSANLQGECPRNSVMEAKLLFGEQLDFYVDVGRLDNPPSTLAVVKDGALVVERQGAVRINS